ncbi:hypothetical protein [Alkalitalea saponilacus]|uniref:Uncharacterized protein n=1 Tax=Alkalitalea saponilacus TaxID=889453 RepID=A0A1T5HTC0_9BACT|nr:hypothetical protein [Alkalitalea saponilacus]ASB50211.1 hypothetical protein CDL62_14225 [Alkalitalea saponilacus]SKC23935.1 hypothetical protein SAMN03080601_03222 [Alkalitalea saponilacus]
MEGEKPKKRMQIAKPIIFVFVGGIMGFLYYNFIGCNGGCSITSTPVNSIITGALLGGIWGIK